MALLYLKLNNNIVPQSLQAFLHGVWCCTFSQRCLGAHIWNATNAVATQDNLIGFWLPIPRSTTWDREEGWGEKAAILMCAWLSSLTRLQPALIGMMVFICIAFWVAADVPHSPAALRSGGKSGKTTHYKIKPLTLHRPWNQIGPAASASWSESIISHFLEGSICANFH